MKITKSQLKQLIKEELENTIREASLEEVHPASAKAAAVDAGDAPMPKAGSRGAGAYTFRQHGERMSALARSISMLSQRIDKLEGVTSKSSYTASGQPKE